MNTLTKTILVALGVGAVIGIALLFPGAGYVYKALKKEEWERLRKKGRLRFAIKRLEKQGLISWAERDGESILTLTDNGEKKILQYKLSELEIKKPDKWDGWWRVIIFDIPEDLKPAREIFRERLKDLGLYQLQKSVFVYPYECKDEIDFLRHNFEIAPYVKYILAKDIPDLDLKLFD